MTNTGTVTMRANSEVYGYNTTPAFDNAGTLVVNPGSTGTATLAGGGSLVINSTGSIQLSSGTLDISSGATLNLNAGSSVSGSGTLEDQGTLGVNSAQSLASPFVVQGGSVSIAAQATLSVPSTCKRSVRQPPVERRKRWPVLGQVEVTGIRVDPRASGSTSRPLTPRCAGRR